MVFGPPGWMPDRIENTFDFKAEVPESPVGTALPTDFLAKRAAQLSFLERIGMGRASAVVPGLIEQLKALPETSDAHGPLPMLVLNLLPTQPEFAIAGALARLAMDDLATGLDALSTMAGRTFIAMDRHDFKLQRLWRLALRTRAEKDHHPAVARRVRFRHVLNEYPQGDPTMLMYTLFGKKLPVGTMPTLRGVLMVDPVSCWAVGRWLRTGQPFTDRPVQLFAAENESPRLVLGRIGETLSEFCSRHHVRLDGMQVILNGMLSGTEINPAVSRIESHTESLTLRERPDIEIPAPCLMCGWCVDVCPTGLQPISLLHLAQRLSTREPGTQLAAGDERAVASVSAQEALHCVGCGLCSYVCPTRLPLMRETLLLKQFVAAADAERAAARETR